MNEVTEGPGAALCAARESLGITCREVAEALNLALRVIESIEVNDYEKLPAPVFTRGYIRAYAKLLELDPDPIVARYSPEDLNDTTREEVAFTSIEDVIRRYPGWFVGGGATIVLVLLGALLYSLWPFPDRFQSGEDLNVFCLVFVTHVRKEVPAFTPKGVWFLNQTEKIHCT